MESKQKGVGKMLKEMYQLMSLGATGFLFHRLLGGIVVNVSPLWMEKMRLFTWQMVWRAFDMEVASSSVIQLLA